MSFPDEPLGLSVELFLNGDWVDVSDRSPAGQTVTVTLGRADEKSTASPASATVTLTNLDGWLTPKDPRSPWYPQIAVDLPVRLLIDGDVELEGTAAQVEPSWPVGDRSDVEEGDLGDLASLDDATLGAAWVSISVAGILRRLGQGRKPIRSALFRLATKTTNLPNISDYWPLEDGVESEHGASALGGAAMATNGLSWAGDSTLTGSGPLPSVRSGVTANWEAAAVGSSGTQVVELVFRCPTEPELGGTEVVTVLEVLTLGTVSRWTMEYLDDFGPSVRYRGYSTTGAMVVDQTYSVLEFSTYPDNWWTVRFRLAQSGGNIAWSFAYTRIPTTGFISTASGTVAGTIGRVVRVGGGTDSTPSGGFSFGHIIVHNGIASGWLIPADQGWPGELAAHRFARLCTEEGIPYTVVGMESDSVAMGVQRPATPLTLLQECADADQAILGETRTEGLVFHTRTSRYNHTVDLSLDASAAQIANPFAPVDDDQSLRNDITVSRVGGASFRVVDAASVDGGTDRRGHGLYDDSVTLNLATDGLIADAAGWALHVGSWEGLRYPQVTIDLAIAPALIPAVKLLTVGSRIQIVNLPPQHPVDTVDLHVEGIADTLSPNSWKVTLNCSPAGPWNVGVLDDPDLGRLDTSGSTIGAVDSTATSFTVTSAGTRWIDSATFPTQFPFEAVVGGERVNVTAIVGTSSPQTFTVERSQNHVVKAHDAGTPLVLAQPLVLAR